MGLDLAQLAEIKKIITFELKCEFSDWHRIKKLCDEAEMMEDNDVTYSKKK